MIDVYKDGQLVATLDGDEAVVSGPANAEKTSQPPTQFLFPSDQDGDGFARLDVAEDEAWREYDYSDRVYRIDAPVTVEYRLGGSTHRVTDADDVTHILPAPGYHGCVIRTKARQTV